MHLMFLLSLFDTFQVPFSSTYPDLERAIPSVGGVLRVGTSLHAHDETACILPNRYLTNESRLPSMMPYYQSPRISLTVFMHFFIALLPLLPLSLQLPDSPF